VDERPPPVKLVLLAATAGGLPAVFGMTVFAGLAEVLLSRYLHRLRMLFPSAISGLVVAVVGLDLGLVGIGHLLVVEITYEGVLLMLPNVGVRHRSFLEEESFSYGLADFLTGVYPDRMESSACGKLVTIRLYFRA
jgi:xanthine/uracil permease